MLTRCQIGPPSVLYVPYAGYAYQPPACCTERTHHRGAGQLVPPVHVYQARGRAVRIPRAVTPQVERLASQYFFEMHADKKDMASYRTVQVGLIVGFAF